MIGGSISRTATADATARPAATTNTVRHPAYALSSTPSGTPATVATVVPAFTIIIALPSRAAGTNWAATASAIDQYPPTATPSSNRATSSNAMFGATATITFDTAAAMVNTINKVRRSSRGNTDPDPSAAASAVNAVALTDSPTTPSATPRSSAITVNTPGGRNSAVTSEKLPRNIVSNAGHTRRPTPGAAAPLVKVEVMPDATIAVAAPPDRNAKPPNPNARPFGRYWECATAAERVATRSAPTRSPALPRPEPPPWK